MVGEDADDQDTFGAGLNVSMQKIEVVFLGPRCTGTGTIYYPGKTGCYLFGLSHAGMDGIECLTRQRQARTPGKYRLLCTRPRKIIMKLSSS